MSNIGPNFRPPWQPPPSSGARPAGEISLPAPASGEAYPANSMQGQTPGLPQAALAPLFAFENALAPDQLVLLLRNLLQMPKEIVQLLATLADMDPTVGQELLKTLLTEDIAVPLDALQQLLQTHADKAQDKLLKLLQSSQMSLTGSGKQMGELMSNLSDMVSKTGKSPMDALHTAISLYLPYYPLHPPQGFTMRFEPSGGGEDGEAGQSDAIQLVLWIETIRLGPFKITIAAGQAPVSTSEQVQTPSRWQVWVEHDPAAASVLEILQEQVSQASGGQHMVGMIFLPRVASGSASASPVAESASESKAAAPSKGKQSVDIQPTGSVSGGILCLAYLLIRVVFELDNREELTQQRAASI